MRGTGRIGFVVAFIALLTSACASTVRNPVSDVPAGEYVRVEPASDAYIAANVNEWAFTARMDDEIWSGKHWVDDEGMIHMADDDGPCADMESIWTYDYANNRVTLDLVEDQCEVRSEPLPDRMVWERNW
jgi:hypothetical protein